MIERALGACDAYTSRTKGPPGRAEIKAVTDHLRDLEHRHACAVKSVCWLAARLLDLPSQPRVRVVISQPIITIVVAALAALGGWLAHG